MEFAGDYGFDEFLAQGGADSDSSVADFLVSFLSHGFYKNESRIETGSFGCSTIYTQDADGAYFFGRNYDWTECSAMIVHTKPKNGYESVSTCCIDFLGFGDGYAPDGTILYAGNGEETTEFEINLSQTGAYIVTVEAQHAKGSIHIQVRGK